jgi:translation elongation factor EF-Ts
MPIAIDEIKLNELVEKVVDERLEKKFRELIVHLIPFVSEEEQKEIERLYGEPTTEVVRVLTLERN